MANTHPTSPDPSPVAASIPDGRYVADPALSELRFKAKAFTIMWVHGRIPAAGGSVQVENGRLSGSGTIAAADISTGMAPRDWHLRSSHYLHTKKHRSIALEIDNVDIEADQATCTVVVRDTPHEVTMTIRSAQVADGLLRIEAETDLDRTVFPMLPPIAGVSRAVHIELTVVARQA